MHYIEYLHDKKLYCPKPNCKSKYAITKKKKISQFPKSLQSLNRLNVILIKNHKNIRKFI